MVTTPLSEVDALIAQHAVPKRPPVAAAAGVEDMLSQPKEEDMLSQPKEEKEESKKAEPVDQNQSKAPATTTTTITTSIEAPPLTGLAEMDEEHLDCTVALNHLLQFPSVPALGAAIDVLTEHFRHEEEMLLCSNSKGKDVDSSFSPYRSHQKDHERILNLGRDELQRLALLSN
jgi:hypothetical protein